MHWCCLTVFPVVSRQNCAMESSGSCGQLLGLHLNVDGIILTLWPLRISRSAKAYVCMMFAYLRSFFQSIMNIILFILDWTNESICWRAFLWKKLRVYMLTVETKALQAWWNDQTGLETEFWIWLSLQYFYKVSQEGWISVLLCYHEVTQYTYDIEGMILFSLSMVGR